jgi:hypothetical protein
MAHDEPVTHPELTNDPASGDHQHMARDRQARSHADGKTVVPSPWKATRRPAHTHGGLGPSETFTHAQVVHHRALRLVPNWSPSTALLWV